MTVRPSPDSRRRLSAPAHSLLAVIALCHCGPGADSAKPVEPAAAATASLPDDVKLEHAEAAAKGLTFRTAVDLAVPEGRPRELSAVDMAVNPLPPRAEEQLKAIAQFGVVTDFKFTDQLAASGITFRSHMVDDAGREYKAVHYDHGFGVAVADVDLDGRNDIYFMTQLGRNELWRNLGGGKFADITAAAGVALADQVSVGAAFADTDNDGDDDLFVTTVRHGNHLFENVGGGKFKDISTAAGVDYSGHSSAAVFLDYDKDGLLDLFVTNVGVYTRDFKGAGDYYIGMRDAFSGHKFPERNEASILYRNAGGNHFVDVTEATGLVDNSWSGDAALVDFNDDLFPDLYLVNMQGDDHYWENVGGKQFVDKTEAYFPKTAWGAIGIGSFDYDNDGRMDLLTTDMHSDMAQKVSPDKEKLTADKWEVSLDYLTGRDNNLFGNVLYHNLGGGKFEEVSAQMNVENYWPWGLSTGDLNADGFVDVVITASMNYPWRYALNSVLLNDRGKVFRDAECILGVEPRRDGRVETPWFEVKCSGVDAKHPVCAGIEGDYTVMGALGSRSSVIFDLDDDGDLDIVTNDFHSEPQILVSDLAQRRAVSFLKVKLVGQESNRSGIGARVQLTAGGQLMTRVNDGSSGFLSHSLLPLYFGLGEATKVDKVEVIWPSGKRQTVAKPTVNTLLTITEG